MAGIVPAFFARISRVRSISNLLIPKMNHIPFDGLLYTGAPKTAGAGRIRREL